MRYHLRFCWVGPHRMMLCNKRTTGSCTESPTKSIQHLQTSKRSVVYYNLVLISPRILLYRCDLCPSKSSTVRGIRVGCQVSYYRRLAGKIDDTNIFDSRHRADIVYILSEVVIDCTLLLKKGMRFSVPLYQCSSVEDSRALLRSLPARAWNYVPSRPQIRSRILKQYAMLLSTIVRFTRILWSR